VSEAILTINSRNYGAWSLRGWLLCKLSGIDFRVETVGTDDAASRAELLLLSSSFLVPSLTHDGTRIWDTLAIAEYLHEVAPAAGLFPRERAARAHCRSVSGEMHSGFYNLRSALPMNLKEHHPGFRLWEGARADVERISMVWDGCLDASGGPFLFGGRPTVADAMYAPVCTRFVTYDVALDDRLAGYRDLIVALPEMKEWTAAAEAEPEEVEELDAEF
jgi:glutathione S-transferase